MKLGFGLYKHMLRKEYYQFARQCGATHVIIHLVDYFKKPDIKNKNDQPVGGSEGWGYTLDTPLWTLEELKAIKKEINEAGLILEGIENFDPAHWYDILLDGPKKKQQVEDIKTIIRRIGEAGIPVMGYNFSIAGVSSRITGPFARGGAVSVGMDGQVDETPIPDGMVWNMIYDDKRSNENKVNRFSHDELWQRLDWFLKEIIPVAEEAGVTMAAHPDDPPVPMVRNTPRLVYQPQLYDKLIEVVDSPSNKLEFCLGSIAEMTEGDVYEATDAYSKQNRIAYIHFRNVVGKAPDYKEVFIDEGDIDMLRILKILKKNNYQGVLIPDHTPQMTCDAPWHAGMAYAMGFMQAALKGLK